MHDQLTSVADGAAFQPRRPSPWRLALAGAGVVAGVGALPAHAQTDASVLVVPAIPDNYDRGRNVSVLETQRPDYDPLGIRSHGFLVFPRLEVDGGATSNVYLTSQNTVAAPVVSVAGSVRADSEWDRDAASLYGAVDFDGYLGQSRRNQTTYDFRALGRKDIGSYYTLTGEAQYARLFETPDTGAIDPALSILSDYQRGFLSARGQYEAGRGRAIIAVDRTSFSFDPIETANGRVNQADRDRVISRVTGEVQYALSPSVSVYAQGTFGGIDYSRRLQNGQPNRDSTGERGIIGLNFDLAGFLRGRVGVGLINRDFHAAIYRDVTGVSAEAQLEYFVTRLTTLTLQVGRTLGDADVSSTSAYFNTRAILRADHELLRNLIVTAQADYSKISYVDRDASNDYYRASGSARYLVSRFVALNGRVSYLKRTGNGLFNSNLDEARVQFGVVLQR